MDHSSPTSFLDNLILWRLGSTFDLQATLEAAISEQNDHIKPSKPVNSMLISLSLKSYTSLKEELPSSELAGPSQKKLKIGSAIHAQIRNTGCIFKNAASHLQIYSEVIVKHD